MSANAIRFFLPVLLVCATALPPRPASAQCLQWESTFATQGFDGPVHALAVYQSCARGEPSLYAGGSFTMAGGVPALNIARWNGSAWSPLGGGIPDIAPDTPSTVTTLCVYDDGSGAGAQLYAGFNGHPASGGMKSGIWRWNGVSWSTVLAPGSTSMVLTMIGFNDGTGPHLYAGFWAGFNTILRWNGSIWSEAGDSPNSPFGFVQNYVRALAVFDDGTGPHLYAGGEFDTPPTSIAKWTGTNWVSVGSGLGGEVKPVSALAVYDSGSGAELYAAGRFNMAGSPPLKNIARWNGSVWQDVGGGLDGDVYALFVYGDGSGGAQLYAAGFFGTAGTTPANRIASWDGTTWSALGTGLSAAGPGDFDIAMAEFDDHASGGSDLYVGGTFATAGGGTSPSIAQWSGCGTQTGVAFCFGDGSLATSCPCAPPNSVPNPPAALNHGCANSFNLDGAQLFGSGRTALDNVVLTTSGQTPVGFAFFLVGTAQHTAGVASADGIRCVDGAFTRFGSQYAACGSVKYPNPAVGWTQPLSVVSGATPGSSVWKYYQVYYRNALVNFCTGATTNFTSAYGLRW